MDSMLRNTHNVKHIETYNQRNRDYETQLQRQMDHINEITKQPNKGNSKEARNFYSFSSYRKLRKSANQQGSPIIGNMAIVQAPREPKTENRFMRKSFAHNYCLNSQKSSQSVTLSTPQANLKKSFCRIGYCGGQIVCLTNENK